ncbi:MULTISPECIES: hypothetical protein [Streptomyces]|uniref:Integral membrane protein n=1 Tax=Streptomyces ardesiacus TaxID=285564 RepID=A0ABW8HE97_9ACTN|nr:MULTISPECIES: hypothetical protein [Streptomyces]KOT95982.1 hypothetical protein ADK87_24500 [Streptomyces sp. NRRL F-4711]KOX26761.1 hypothetical protein ADL07_31940 [Streptomyces sp. NRRL F-4707]KOX47725.1 hypothetical protein ADL09_13020 [Streptomyces sp. NRRL F-7442]MCL7366429.1 hypothetical protein [Streptomyces ardesiacus]
MNAHAGAAAGSPAPRGILRGRPEQWLFKGIYGLVLASALVAALDVPGEKANPGQDALWVLLTALVSAVAHGYAHVIARRASGDGAARPGRVRAVLDEWPLVAAALPTVVLVLAASAGWWAEETAVDTALGLNTVSLFCLGVTAARAAGLGRLASCRAGALDMLLGLAIIAADALID